MKVMVFGTFDLLHPGHLFVIEQALKRGDVHVIVARDTNVERIKGRAPHESEIERLQEIQKTFPAAHVHLGDESNFLAPVKRIQPDLILLGYDQKFPPGIQEEDLPCTVERLEAFEPEKWKSSLRRK